MKHIKLLFLLLFVSSFGFAQTTLSEWILNTNGNPNNVDADVTAGLFTSTGGAITYGANGAFRNGWSTGILDLNEYFEISISPNTGFDILLEDVLFSERRSGTGIRDYQVRYSKDITFATFTTLATVNVPDNTAERTGDITGLSETINDGETLYIRFYGYNAEAGGGTWRINDNTLELRGTVSASSTSVEFVSTTSTLTEDGLFIDVCVAITNEDATNATTVEIDLDGLSTTTNGTDYDDGAGTPVAITFPQTITFPSGSSLNQCLTVFISNDDAIYELSESVILNLQNAAGGSSATLGTNTQHTLTITDNDPDPCVSIFSDDFSSGLAQWNNTADWTTVGGELKHDITGTSGDSTINSNVGLQNFNSGDYEWSLCMRNGNWDPSGGNNFSFVLISDTDDTSNDITGYRLGINHVSGETDDLLKLYRVNNGVDAAILTTTLDWDANDDICLRVTRSNTGNWELFYDDGSGEVSGGTVNDDIYSAGSFISLFFKYSSTRAGLFWVDDVNVCKAPISCPTTSTWNGTSWSPSIPDANTNAILNANYNTSVVGQPEFTSFSLTINSGFSLTITPTNYVEVITDVTNNGKIFIQDKGSFVQVDIAATYDDSGSSFFATDNTAQVTRSTATINDWFEYTYWSSPVSNETVEDVLFTANPDRRFTFNAANFADLTFETNNNNATTAYTTGDILDDIDDNGDDWEYASGLMIQGVGYAATLSTTSFSTPGQFDHIFEGTLNNGDINVPIVRNDTSNSTSAVPDNNWNFIGNPYPSAIDIDLFFAANNWSASNTNATLDGNIYLWSQNSPPSDTNNGNQTLNFTGDYAIINGMGETAGGDMVVPTRHISSAQGFFVNFVDTADRASSTGNVI